MDNDLYVVASFTNTVPGKLIIGRAAMKFWDRYAGDCYSHISLSRDSKLNNMMSFARKEIKNPFNSGLIKEDIRDGMFALNKDVSEIAVMQLPVTEQQYSDASCLMDEYWKNKEDYGFNFAGLATMLFCGKGVSPENKFFCSQWVSTVLRDSGIDLFQGEDPKNIRPFDFYAALKDHIIYEGLVKNYPEYVESPEEYANKPKTLTLERW